MYTEYILMYISHMYTYRGTCDPDARPIAASLGQRTPVYLRTQEPGGVVDSKLEPNCTLCELPWPLEIHDCYVARILVVYMDKYKMVAKLVSNNKEATFILGHQTT